MRVKTNLSAEELELVAKGLSVLSRKRRDAVVFSCDLERRWFADAEQVIEKSLSEMVEKIHGKLAS